MELETLVMRFGPLGVLVSFWHKIRSHVLEVMASTKLVIGYG